MYMFIKLFVKKVKISTLQICILNLDFKIVKWEKKYYNEMKLFTDKFVVENRSETMDPLSTIPQLKIENQNF